MKKLVLIIILLLNGAVLFGQTKPTKQETIDWLTAQIRKHAVYTEEENGRIVSYYTYEITDDYKTTVTEKHIGKYGGTSRITFSLNDICDAYLSSSNFLVLKFKQSITSSYRSNDNSYSDSDEEQTWPINFNNIDNIKERMLKAFKTLAEYNCPPAKNTF